MGLMEANLRRKPGAVITTDASGTWGGAGFNSQGQWFQLQWPSVCYSIHITVKELFPIVVASATWGKHWRGLTVKCVCDNAAVVAIINSGRSKDKLAMHLLQCLFFFAAELKSLSVCSTSIGEYNVAADALSRNNVSLFFQQVPQANKDPSTLPPELVQALVLQQPDWTSVTWRSLFNSILQKV